MIGVNQDPNIGSATQFKPGESGNPTGPKPGYKHLSTHIQELLNDEDFVAENIEQEGKKVTYKGAPIKAIVRVAAVKALQGDTKWAEWIGKYGYGSKLELANNPDNPITPTQPVSGDVIAAFITQVKNGTKQS